DILVPRNVAFISDIAVMKSHQGKGAGYALFQQCTEWAKSKGADSLDLMVWEFNREAIAFYERQGMGSMHRTMSLELK
ncbi:MAG TPA: N-acetyltransferase, partial [Ktedonobacter sp.]|nr:N-acetyltransferase [Ktedonobacter sp.]